MILLIWFCVIHVVLGEKGHGEKESEEKKEQRFVVEDDYKPALFGSYSYDPIKQVFVPPHRNGTNGTSTTMSQIVNETYVKSTAVGVVTDATDSPTEVSNVFRNAFAKNLLHTTKKTDTTQWWQRKDTRNLTMNLDGLNLPNFKAKPVDFDGLDIPNFDSKTDNLFMKDKEKDLFKDKNKIFP